MRQGLEALTDKEKQTLRLLLDGHDAKSMARHLGLSVHTVNERLRFARRKLSASSSREAARLLRECEAALPHSLGDRELGDAPAGPIAQLGGPPDPGPFAIRRLWPIGGLVMISSLVAALALLTPQSAPDRAPSAGRTAAVAESPVTQTARQWLALVDAGRWQDSFVATAKSFQTLNTLAMWQSASEGGRVPMGRVLSRGLTLEESIPAPPNGYQLVRFRTDFANKPGTTETLSLAREGGGWRVAGYIIE
jgi:DNA-binding CsgD family transcriptional regulator